VIMRVRWFIRSLVHNYGMKYGIAILQIWLPKCGNCTVNNAQSDETITHTLSKLSSLQSAK